MSAAVCAPERAHMYTYPLTQNKQKAAGKILLMKCLTHSGSLLVPGTLAHPDTTEL